MRYRYDPTRGEVVPAHEIARPAPARSHLSAPRVIADTMAPVRSMVDGQTYDSKSTLRASYRDHGVEEVGNDYPRTPKPRTGPDRAEVRAACVRAMTAAGFGGME